MDSTRVHLPNEHLRCLKHDYLFHLGIDMDDSDVLAKFRDVKFLCVGGTASRMEKLARHFAQEMNLQIADDDEKVFDFSFTNERYSGYKVGPVFCVNHGIGTPSLSVMLHELFKLLERAECSDVTLIRLGTCGGLGVAAGTVVISTGALTAGMEPVYHTSSLGQPLKLPTKTDADLVNDLFNCQKASEDFEVVTGLTYCSDDFYQGQGRLDGSFCDYTKQDQEAFFATLHDHGVRNIEMESAGVLALAHKVGLKAAVVCVVLVNRLQADMPTASQDQMEVFQERPIQLVGRYIKHKLSSKHQGGHSECNCGIHS